MQHKTITTLGELRIGDSFVYKSRTDAWRVMHQSKDKKWTFVNQLYNGKPLYNHDEQRRAKTTVTFLRHTIPVQGEECFMEDLKKGDVFHQLEDIVHEWEVVETGHDFWTVRRLDQAAPGKAGRLAKVVFVRGPL